MELSYPSKILKQVNQMLHISYGQSAVCVTASVSAVSQFRQRLYVSSFEAVFEFGRLSPLLTFHINGMSGHDILSPFLPLATEVKPS